MAWRKRTKSRHYIQVFEGLLDPVHIKQLGIAVWFYIYCLYRQTTQDGWIFDGNPKKWPYFAEDMGIPERTIRRWASTCSTWNYIEIIRTKKGVKIRVTKPKKKVARSGL